MKMPNVYVGAVVLLGPSLFIAYKLGEQAVLDKKYTSEEAKKLMNKYEKELIKSFFTRNYEELEKIKLSIRGGSGNE